MRKGAVRNLLLILIMILFACDNPAKTNNTVGTEVNTIMNNNNNAGGEKDSDTNSGDETESGITGIWNGTYSYDCKQNAFPPNSSSLVMEITQSGDDLSGKAFYLGGVTSLTGRITGDTVSLSITGSSSITQNVFTGTHSGSSISGITLNGEGCSAPTGPSGTFIVTKSDTSLPENSPAKLKILGPSTFINNTCAAYTVEVQDGAGNPSVSTSDVTVSLSGGGSGSFYLNSTCSTTTASVLIPSGGMSQNFFFKDAAAEAVTVTVADTSGHLAADNSIVTVTATGGGITFNLDGVSSNYSQGASAQYWVGGAMTIIDGADSARNFFQVFVAGNVVGPYTCANMYYQDSTGKQWGAGGSIGGLCTVVITNYGEVGQLIQGTFSGSLVAQFGGATGSKSITTGVFSIYRNQNQ